MKKNKKQIRTIVVMAVAVGILMLTGCGKKKEESQQSDWEDLMEDAQETFGDTGESGDADDWDDREAVEDSADDADFDEEGWSGDCYRFELEGKNAAALNGKITSILLADDSRVYASTADGGLFLLRPSVYFSKEETEIKSYPITEDCGISELVYADQHIAYGKNHFVYFEMMEGFDEAEMEELYMMESLADMPDIAYTFENMQKGVLSGDLNLIFLTEEASFYVYEDTDHHVCAGYKDYFSEEYTTFADVLFEGDSERNGVTLEKSIFRFVLTKDQELLFIRKGNVTSDLADNVEGVSVSYVDLTDQIDGNVTDIYNMLNSTEYCYAVDEEQNIYFVSAIDPDSPTAEKIAQFEQGTIADIQGFAGTNEEMLIKTEEGAYYFCDSDSLYPVRKVEALDGNYKNAVLLMEGDILALGNDGYLYVVEDKN